jgi:hypothetical protein
MLQRQVIQMKEMSIVKNAIMLWIEDVDVKVVRMFEKKKENILDINRDHDEPLKRGRGSQRQTTV